MKDLRWNYIWYSPVSLACMMITCGLSEIGYHWARLLALNWRWLLLISPSTWLWLAASIVAISLPLRPVFLIPLVFQERTKTSHRLGSIGFIFFTSVAGLLICLLVAWGSFPLNPDKNGLLQLRLVPFLPLPNFQLGHSG
jgi:hypothetical protein